MTRYPVARGWFKAHLHYIYGDVWYQWMMKSRQRRKCKLPREVS